jgi:hypothetical protein
VLLAALAHALTKVTNYDLNSIMLEGIGHISNKVDLSRTVGWFTTMFPVSLDGGANMDIGKVIQVSSLHYASSHCNCRLGTFSLMI